MSSVAIPPPQRKFALRKNGTVSLKSSVRELLVQKFISGETSILKNLGFQCRSVEEFKVEKYDDGLLLLLREELQNPSPAPNTSLRAALLKARFSDTITAKAACVDAAASTSENSRKRKRVDEILDSERKKRREEVELKSIQLRLQKEKEEQQKRDGRAAARAELENVKKENVNWPEDNFWAMREFELLLRGGY